MSTHLRVLLLVLMVHPILSGSTLAADWTVKVGEGTYIGLRESPYADYTMVYLGLIECKIDLPLRSLLSLVLGIIAMVVIVWMAALFWPKPIEDGTDI